MLKEYEGKNYEILIFLNEDDSSYKEAKENEEILQRDYSLFG